jgi:hypothetical protein
MKEETRKAFVFRMYKSYIERLWLTLRR